MIDIDFKTLTDRDYIIIGEMWAKKSALLEHRVIMAIYIGRPLERGEIVHHIDHDASNNNIDNLILCKDALNHHSTDDFIKLYKKNNINYKLTKDRELIFPSIEVIQKSFINEFKNNNNE